MIQIIGMIAAVTLPLWNIPLILKIIKRKSSRDISLWWAYGVLGSLVAMLPAALVSSDPVFRVFSIANVLLFSLVVILVVKYRKRGA